MSVWNDIRKRGIGADVKKEEKEIISDKEQFAEVLKENVKDSDGDLAKVLAELNPKLSLPEIQSSLLNIEDTNKLLTDDEKLLLQTSLILSFSLRKYKSLEDLLRKQDVRVIIMPGKPRRSALFGLTNRYINLLKRELKRLQDSDNLDKEKEEELKELLEDLKGRNMSWQNMPLRGRYVTVDEKYFDSIKKKEVHHFKKEIHLFPENMKKEYSGEKMNELLVSTLVHESMHAYFDRYPRHFLPYVRPVEEPMAEFGMLLYLKETLLAHYFEWAYQDVENKRTCYRYGTALMDKHIKESKGGAASKTREDLELYKIF